MKKLFLLLMFTISFAAFSATYQEGTYRGYYFSKGELEVEVQFDVVDDVIKDIVFRALNYKKMDWLKDEAVKDHKPQYEKVLAYLEGQKITDELLDKLIKTNDNIEIAGATVSGGAVRGGKVRYAVKQALLIGPMREIRPKK